jgi:exopolysaccharide biosynthesis WecB/TagA/CpsF family protein
LVVEQGFSQRWARKGSLPIPLRRAERARDPLAYSGVVHPDIPAIEIMGVPLASLAPEAAIGEIVRLYERNAPAQVAYVNAHGLNLAWEDRSFGDLLRRTDLVLNDGKGVMLAARLLGRRFPADLNGNFFSPHVLQLAAKKGWPAFFLGAKPGIAAKAADLLSRRFEGLNVLGTQDGYFTTEEEDDVVQTIRDSGAGLLLVAMGNPAQERWIDRFLDKTGVRLGLGVGAFFDFQTGTVARAPKWMNSIGMEWIHRLYKEPRRMWRRYIFGNPRFIARVLRSRG